MEEEKKPKCEICCHDCYEKDEEEVICPVFRVTVKTIDEKSFKQKNEESDDIYFT